MGGSLLSLLMLGTVVLGTNALHNLTVIDGHTARLGTFPNYIVLRFVDERGKEQLCGGSLLTPSSILSAAHCYERFASGLALAGLVNLDHYDEEALQIKEIATVTRHPNYSPGDKHSAFDLAIVKIVGAFQMTKFSQTTEIMEDDDFVRPGSKVVTTGFGRVAPKIPSKRLRWAKVLTRSFTKCREVYSWANRNHICAGIAKYGAAPGDSGSPLLYYHNSKYIQIGIVHGGSTKHPYHQDKWPSVYIRPSRFCAFLKEEADYLCTGSHNIENNTYQH